MELKHIAADHSRLSAFLRQEMGLSTGLMNRLKWKNAIFVNGQPRRTDYQVQPGDEICVLLDEPAPEYPAEQGQLTILYEDEDLLAVDKPAGMLIHPSRSQNTGTLANLVLGYYEKTGQKSAFHPVTRLDRDTFGIVLLAKNAHVHRLLQTIQMEKTYHALTFGGPSADSGVIDAPIIRLPLPSLLRKVSPEGKPSVTQYQVLERQSQMCRLALTPVTGRTHQLRLHCAYSGFPILGDPQYQSEASAALSKELELSTQQLCAKELVFAHPITGKLLRLWSKMDIYQV